MSETFVECKRFQGTCYKAANWIHVGKTKGRGRNSKSADVEEDWYGDTPLFGIYSIDYLIGEEAYLGKGIGKSIINLLVKEIFSLKASKRIIVQPDKDNKASCNSLLSNGFTFDTKNNFYIIAKKAQTTL